MFDAKSGYNLASAPKLRPDRQYYTLHGRIEVAAEKPEFLASAAFSKADEFKMAVNRVAAGNYHGNSSSTKYYKVIVPKAMQDYYFNGAKIEGGFDLVGRYVGNTKYTTISGQEKSAPVFEAVYFEFW